MIVLIITFSKKPVTEYEISAVRALRKYLSPEEIKEAAMSKTSKAFDRYIGKANDNDILSIYRSEELLIFMNRLIMEYKHRRLKQMPHNLY